MPYIKKEERKKYETILRHLRMNVIPNNPGHLNYLIRMICSIYLENNKESYATYNEIMGALECAKTEFYRRKIAPYEDKKIKSRENGDIF